MLQALSDALLSCYSGNLSLPQSSLRHTRAILCEKLLLFSGSSVHLPSGGTKGFDSASHASLHEAVGVLSARLKADGCPREAEVLWKRAGELASSIGEDKANAIIKVLAALSRPSIPGDVSGEAARVSSFWFHGSQLASAGGFHDPDSAGYTSDETSHSRSVARALFAMPDVSAAVDRRLPPAAVFSDMPAAVRCEPSHAAAPAGASARTMPGADSSSSAAVTSIEHTRHQTGRDRHSTASAPTRVRDEFDDLYGDNNAYGHSAFLGGIAVDADSLVGDDADAVSGFGAAVRGLMGFGLLRLPPAAPEHISGDAAALAAPSVEDAPSHLPGPGVHGHGLWTAGPLAAAVEARATPSTCPSPTAVLLDAAVALPRAPAPADPQLVALLRRDAHAAFAAAALLALSGSPSSLFMPHAHAEPRAGPRPLTLLPCTQDSTAAGLRFVPMGLHTALQAAARSHAFAAPPAVQAALLTAADAAANSVLGSAAAVASHVCRAAACLRAIEAKAFAATLSTQRHSEAAISLSELSPVAAALSRQLLLVLRMHCSRMLAAIAAVAAAWKAAVPPASSAARAPVAASSAQEAPPSPLQLLRALEPWSSLLFEIHTALRCDDGGHRGRGSGGSSKVPVAVLPSLLRRLQALQEADPADGLGSLGACDHGDEDAVGGDVLRCLADPPPPTRLAVVSSLVAAALRPFAALAARPLRVHKDLFLAALDEPSGNVSTAVAAARAAAPLLSLLAPSGKGSSFSRLAVMAPALSSATYAAAADACSLLQAHAPSAAAALLAPLDLMKEQLPWPATDGEYWDAAAAARAQCVVEVRRAAAALIESLVRRGILTPAALQLLQQPSLGSIEAAADAAAAEKQLSALLAAASDNRLLRRSHSAEDAATVALLLRWQLPGLLRGVRAAFGTAGLPDHVPCDGRRGACGSDGYDDHDGHDQHAQHAASTDWEAGSRDLYSQATASSPASALGVSPTSAMSARLARVAGSTAAVRAARAEQEAAAATARAAAEEARRVAREDLLQQAADAAARRAAARAAARAEDAKLAASLADASSPRRADGTLIPTYSHVYAGSSGAGGSGTAPSGSPRALVDDADGIGSTSASESVPAAEVSDPAAALVAQARSFLLGMYGRRLQQLSGGAAAAGDDADGAGSKSLLPTAAAPAGRGGDSDADPQLLALDALASIGPSGISLAEETAAALGLEWGVERVQPSNPVSSTATGDADACADSIEVAAQPAPTDPADLPAAGRPLTLLASLPTTRDRQQLFRMSSRGQLGDVLVGSLPELALHLPQRFLTHVKVTQPPGGRDRVGRALGSGAARTSQRQPSSDTDAASSSPAAVGGMRSDEPGQGQEGNTAASAADAGFSGLSTDVGRSPRHETSADRLLRLRAAMGTLAPVQPAPGDVGATAASPSAQLDAHSARPAAGGRGGFEESDEHEDGSFRPHKRALQPPGGRTQLDVLGGGSSIESESRGVGSPRHRAQPALGPRPYALERGGGDAGDDVTRTRAAVKVSQPPGGGSAGTAHLLAASTAEDASAAAAAAPSPTSGRRQGMSERQHPSFESGAAAAAVRASTVVSQPAGGASSIGDALFPSVTTAAVGSSVEPVHTHVHVSRPPGGGVSQTMVEALGGSSSSSPRSTAASLARGDHHADAGDDASSTGSPASALTSVVVSQPPGGHSTIAALLHNEYAAGPAGATRHYAAGVGSVGDDAATALTIGPSASVAASQRARALGGSAMAALLVGSGHGDAISDDLGDSVSVAGTGSGPATGFSSGYGESMVTSVRVTQPSGGTSTVQLLLGAGQLNEGARRAAGARAAEAALVQADRGLHSTAHAGDDHEAVFGNGMRSSAVARRLMADAAVESTLRASMNPATTAASLGQNDDEADMGETPREAAEAGGGIVPCALTVPISRVLQVLYAAPLRCRIGLTRTCGAALAVLQWDLFAHYAALRAWMLGGEGRALTAVADAVLACCTPSIDGTLTWSPGAAVEAAVLMAGRGDEEGKGALTVLMAGEGDEAFTSTVSAPRPAVQLPPQLVAQRLNDALESFRSDVGHASAWADYRDSIAAAVQAALSIDARTGQRGGASNGGRGHLLAWAAGLAHSHDSASSAPTTAAVASKPAPAPARASASSAVAMEALQELLAAVRSHLRLDAAVAHMMRFRFEPVPVPASTAATAVAGPEAAVQGTKAAAAASARAGTAAARAAAPASRPQSLPCLLLARVRPVYNVLQHPLADGKEGAGHTIASASSTSTPVAATMVASQALPPPATGSPPPRAIAAGADVAYATSTPPPPSAIASIITPASLRRYARVHGLLLRLRVTSGALGQLWTALMRAEGQTSVARSAPAAAGKGAAGVLADASAAGREVDHAARETRQRSRRVLALFRHEAALLTRHLEEHVARQVHSAAFPALLQRSAEAGDSLEALAAVHDNFTRDLLERCLLPDVSIQGDDDGDGDGGSGGGAGASCALSAKPTVQALPRQRLLQQGKERLESLLDLILSVCTRGQVFLTASGSAKAAGLDSSSEGVAFVDALKQLRQGLRVLAAGVRVIAAGGSGNLAAGNIGAGAGAVAGRMLVAGEGPSHLEELLAVLEGLQPRVAGGSFKR